MKAEPNHLCNASYMLAACEVLASAQCLNEFRQNTVSYIAEFLSASNCIIYGRSVLSRNLVPIAHYSRSGSDLSAPELDSSRESEFYELLNCENIQIESTSDYAPQIAMLRQRLFSCSGTAAIFSMQQQGHAEAQLVIASLLDSSELPEKLNFPDFGNFCNVVANLNRQFVILNSLSNETNDLTRSVNYLRKSHSDLSNIMPRALSARIIGNSPKIIELREKITRFATSDASVLILGETGTGKELVAENIHALSNRCNARMIRENIAAIPEQLIESELFGHVKGAFTGADSNREGLIRKAERGTLFIDEVTEIPVNLQIKLLRILQEKKVRAVGGESETEVDFRFVTATHGDFESQIANGSFREDLYYRLSQLVIKVPPLRERKEDIPLLAEHFLTAIASRENMRPFCLDKEAGDRLVQHDFPGNVRELSNIMERVAATVVAGEVISASVIENSLEAAIGNESLHTVELSEPSKKQLSKWGLKRTQAEMEKNILSRCYKWHNGDRGEMARFLKIPKRTLSEKLVRLNVSHDC